MAAEALPKDAILDGHKSRPGPEDDPWGSDSRQKIARASQDRGRGASRFRWHRGGGTPSEIDKPLTLVRDWSTDSRYDSRESKGDQAEPFPMAGEAIVTRAAKRILDGHHGY